jgi:signal transduction histidine kinase
MEPLAWSLAAIAAIAAMTMGAKVRRDARSAERERADDAAETAATRALAASDERARIAREMHDIVAHTLTVVVAQADGARFASAKDPDAASRALATIGEVGRAAITEMRGLLGVLRATDPETDLGPQPTLDDIPALVSAVRDGGLEVSYVTTGTPRPLPIGAGLALYRIVQEALTNVLKHAGPKATAYVQLRWMDDAVEATIRDDGRGAAAGRRGDGTGVEGMRERATIFGGTLSAGPRRGGGYVVRARLPLTPRRDEA